MTRAQSLRQETALNSITPERAGGIMYDTAALLNQQQLQGTNPLLISKIYASIEAMEADDNPVSDITGEALKPGQIVVISSAQPDEPDEGLVYRFNGIVEEVSSWTCVGKIGSSPYLEGYQFMGKAVLTPTPTDPGVPTQKVFYQATEPGTYTNFGGIVVADGEVVNLKWDGTAWNKEVTGAVSDVALAATDAKLAGVAEEITRYDYTQLEPAADVTGKFIHTDGSERTNANTGYYKFAVPGGGLYAFSGSFGSAYNIYYLYAFDENGQYISRIGFATASTTYVKQRFTAPAGTAYITLNYQTSRKSQAALYSVASAYISSVDLDNRVSALERAQLKKKMRVNVLSFEPGNGMAMLRVRSRYNAEKDIMLTFKENNNGVMSPTSAYIGPNTATDDEIIADANLVNSCSDSTAPLFNSAVYWHLFAQHGYAVPTIGNSVGMTASDVGAKWKDQLDREYIIGNVTAARITLLPVIYQDGSGHDTRGWKTPDSAAPETLTHVSGGSYTTTFTVSSPGYSQLRPLMRHLNRVFMADGAKITAPGVYDCDEFKVSETQAGYDPATISNFFPVYLDDAEVMAYFTWSYTFFGATYCANTTIDIRRPVEFLSYGANQQQFFFDKVVGDNTYKAMFIIPKAKARNGVDFERPFNLPNDAAGTVAFYRTAAYLNDVDDPIDRLIGFLHDEVHDTYIVGLAAGLSLVSGDTVREKRIQNIPQGDTNQHYRLGSVSPANTNKFYIAAFNTAPFAGDDYYAPDTLFKEINYYVAYFDPAQNVGQVYWYKDGDQYVIYAHCQSAQDRLALSVPEELEGLSLSVVEKTDGATLLSSTVQNGKIFVSYTNDPNYVVIKAR